MADPEKAMEVENDHEDIEEDDDDADAPTNAKATMAAELLKNPAMFAALQVISCMINIFVIVYTFLRSANHF